MRKKNKQKETERKHKEAEGKEIQSVSVMALTLKRDKTHHRNQLPRSKFRFTQKLTFRRLRFYNKEILLTHVKIRRHFSLLHGSLFHESEFTKNPIKITSVLLKYKTYDKCNTPKPNSIYSRASHLSFSVSDFHFQYLPITLIYRIIFYIYVS